MAGKAKKSFLRNIKNPLETVGEFGDPTGVTKGVARSLIDDLGKGGASDFLDFIGLGGSTSTQEQSKYADSTEVEIVNFNQKTAEAQKPEAKGKKTEQRVEAAIDYHRDIIRTSERASSKEMHTISTQVEQIKAELISLAKSTKMLQMEISTVSVEQAPKNIGVYHAHFFEWMLSMVRLARERVETSEAWMSAQKGKMGKKGYWGMFKKHGTQFGLSNERAVATQVG